MHTHLTADTLHLPLDAPQLGEADFDVGKHITKLLINALLHI